MELEESHLERVLRSWSKVFSGKVRLLSLLDWRTRDMSLRTGRLWGADGIQSIQVFVSQLVPSDMTPIPRAVKKPFFSVIAPQSSLIQKLQAVMA